MKSVTRMIAAAVLIGLLVAPAEARPVSTADEMSYLKTTIGKIAAEADFKLDENSLTMETWGDIMNTVWNYSPFRLLGVQDDRAYNVFFKLVKGDKSYLGRTHFRALENACSSTNNTTAQVRSSISGKTACLSLHVSPLRNDLDAPVAIDSFFYK